MDAIRIFPPPAGELQVEELHTDIHMPLENPWNPELPYIAINVVSSLDGKTSLNGRANPIGGPADRRVMRNIRSRFDAVLRGGRTVRAERISLGVTEDLSMRRVAEGREAQPLDLIISSNIRALPLDTNLLDVTPGRVAVLVPSTSSPSDDTPFMAMEGGIQAIKMPATADGFIDLVLAMKTLKRDHGVGCLLLEGGPQLSNAFLSHHMVNELFLTLAPKLLGATLDDLELTGDKDSRDIQESLSLISAHVSEDELFLRYSVQIPATTDR